MGRKGVRSKLNTTETKFVEAYTAEGSPTYMNATKSYQVAFGGPYSTANAAGHGVVKRPLVQRTMKEMLAETDIADKVREGLYKIVTGFITEDKYRARDFNEVAKIVAEIRGDKAPDKQVVMHLTPEDREKEYEAITDLVLKKQSVRKDVSISDTPVKKLPVLTTT